MRYLTLPMDAATPIGMLFSKELRRCLSLQGPQSHCSHGFFQSKEDSFFSCAILPFLLCGKEEAQRLCDFRRNAPRSRALTSYLQGACVRRLPLQFTF